MDKRTNELKVTGLVGMPTNSIYEEKDDIAPAIAYEGEGEHTLSYRVEDYFCNVIAEGNVSVCGAGTYVISFAKKPHRGHYVVYTEIDGTSTGREDLFAVVVNSDERKYYDSLIGLDIAAYGIITSRVNDYAKAAHLAGVTSVRERTHEGAYHKSLEGCDLSGVDATVNAYAQYGIRVLPLNHSVLAWARTNKRRAIDDIRIKYDYYKTVAKRYDGKVDYEIWNEPELDQMTGGPMTADNMAAVFKAEAIALRDSGADCMSVMPGMASAPGEYLDLLMQNDLDKFIDTYSYHGHRICWGEQANDLCDLTPPPSWERHATDFIAKYDLGNLYLYNTEAGIAPEMLNGKNFIEAERQKAQARYLPASIMQGAAMGEDKHYYFLFPSYREHNLQWGMFTYSHTPYASYSALSTLTHVLGEAKYVNSVPDLPEGTRGEVFADGDKRVAGFWSESKTEITVKTDAESGVLVDIMGNETEISSDGGEFKLTVSPDTVYLKINGNFVGATERKFPEREFKPHVLTRAERVVIELIFPDSAYNKAKHLGYRLFEGEPNTIIARVTNFNDKTITGTLVGRASGGWQIAENEKEITLGAMEQKDIEFTVTSTGNVMPELMNDILFVGEFDGELTSRTVARVISEKEADNLRRRPVKKAMNAKNWNDNVREGSVLSIRNIDEDTLEIECDFGEGRDRWLYPEMSLKKGDTFEGTQGMMFDFFIEDVEDMPTVRIFAHEKNGCRYFLAASLFTLKPGWNKIKIPWSRLECFDEDDNFTLDLFDIVKFAIGVNSNTRRIKYRLRNISVYRAPADDVFTRLTCANPMIDGRTVTVDADIIVKETGLCEDAISVTVGHEKKPFTFTDGKLHSQFDLPAGNHTVTVRFKDEFGRISCKAFPITLE